jgi:MOSC domain-containing protein YiiM
MLKTVPQVGKVDWLSYRPTRRADVEVVDIIEIEIANSIVGDHFSGKAGSTRQITLIQAEHIKVVSDILGQEISPAQLRRNIVVSGINLLALKGQNFKIGNAILTGTGNCPPCSRMEENLGPGGYNAMRGHGGITASVVESGAVCVGDSVQLLDLP